MKNALYASGCAALVGLAIISAGAAGAQSTTPVFNGTTGSPGDVTYSYGLYLGADTATVNGNEFTIYDFKGLLGPNPGDGDFPTFTSGGLVGTSFNVSVQNLGLNPPGTAALGGDNPGIFNVTVTQTGSGFANTTSGTQYLGTLQIHSALPVALGQFTAFAASDVKNSNSTAAGNQGFIDGPNTDTPEPGALATFAGLGVSGLIFTRRRKR